MTRSDDSSPTPKPPILPALSRVAWMSDPATLAQHLTKGKYTIPPHVDLLSKAIVETVEKGGRLLVQMPPRHSKSETCSVWTPAWFLNRWPDRHVMLASYEADFAAGFGRRTRNVIEQHQDELLVSLSEDSSAAHRWHTPEGGGMVTAGVGGPLTGRGAHLLIVDDPHKNAEEAYSAAAQQRLWEWWTSTALTRLEPGAAVIVIQTRWHEGDLAGRILRHEPGIWTVLRLPALAEEDDPIGRKVGEALWPERYDAQDFAAIRASVGSRVWAAGYQQAPVAATGTMFRREWWAPERRYREEAPGCYVLPDGVRVGRESLLVWAAVDLATSVKTTADYTAIVTVARTPDARILVLDVYRVRLEGPDLVPAMRRALEKWDSSAMWVEKVGFQAAIIQEASRQGLPVREARPNGDKVTRAMPLTAALEGGRLLLPEHALWLEAFEDELAAFPAARHDDMVDALAYAWAQDGTGQLGAPITAVWSPGPPVRRITWRGSVLGEWDPKWRRERREGRGRLFPR